jgi:predicted methyltransferase
MHCTRRRAAALFAAAPLAACGRRETAEDADAAPRGSLAWAAAGDWRLEPERDAARHPVETLEFWGIQPDMTVLEILPGLGWYTAILAPYLSEGGGRLIVASFDPNNGSVAQRETVAAFEARFLRDPRRFGRIDRVVAPTRDRGAPLARAQSVDLAILANNTHTLMAEGAAERVFSGVYEALKHGGVFGVEQHRAASTGEPDPIARSGYVQEAYVKKLAQEAGFTFVAASDINANPRDTREHPFGVWTLPPTLRTSPLGQPADPAFDSAPYQEIGESDRMTLKFRKPIRPSATAPADLPPPANPGAGTGPN